MTSGFNRGAFDSFLQLDFLGVDKRKGVGAARPFFIDQAKEATTVLYMHTSSPLV